MSKVIFRELNSLRKAQDEPDFMHSITEDAHKLAKEIIEGAYTHSTGSAPNPAAAPDGDGGVVVEWKSGNREVRLVLNDSTYIYSRSDGRGEVVKGVSGMVLADILRQTFEVEYDVE